MQSSAACSAERRQPGAAAAAGWNREVSVFICLPGRWRELGRIRRASRDHRCARRRPFACLLGNVDSTTLAVSETVGHQRGAIGRHRGDYANSPPRRTPGVGSRAARERLEGTQGGTTSERNPDAKASTIRHARPNTRIFVVDTARTAPAGTVVRARLNQSHASIGGRYDELPAVSPGRNQRGGGGASSTATV